MSSELAEELRTAFRQAAGWPAAFTPARNLRLPPEESDLKGHSARSKGRVGQETSGLGSHSEQSSLRGWPGRGTGWKAGERWRAGR